MSFLLYNTNFHRIDIYIISITYNYFLGTKVCRKIKIYKCPLCMKIVLHTQRFPVNVDFILTIALSLLKVKEIVMS